MMITKVSIYLKKHIRCDEKVAKVDQKEKEKDSRANHENIHILLVDTLLPCMPKRQMWKVLRIHKVNTLNKPIKEVWARVLAKLLDVSSVDPNSIKNLIVRLTKELDL